MEAGAFKVRENSARCRRSASSRNGLQRIRPEAPSSSADRGQSHLTHGRRKLLRDAQRLGSKRAQRRQSRRSPSPCRSTPRRNLPRAEAANGQRAAASRRISARHETIVRSAFSNSLATAAGAEDRGQVFQEDEASYASGSFSHRDHQPVHRRPAAIPMRLIESKRNIGPFP